MSRAREGIDVEELLGSRGRIRVLQVLAENGELNISEVGRRTGMNYTSVERHLEALRKMGLLREKRYGKIRIYEALFRTISVSFERGRGVRVETYRASDI
ncbi:MAG: ArsR/SmtB family transcription factor [Candidatus Bathyarchaeia archaeon]